MRATIVISSYWGRPAHDTFDIKDAVYDHPTPLDEPGTIERALESIKVLVNKDFNVVVLACATTPDIVPQVEKKLADMVAPFRDHFPVACLSHSFEDDIKRRLAECAGEQGLAPDPDVVSLTGYSNIRNMCVVAAELARSEVAVLFDDDEVYEDPAYLDKAFESIDATFDGRPVRALAGYYVRPEGGYLLPPPDDWWMTEWPMCEAMNEAFALIAEQPRLKPTPFVFGGNMVIHRDAFRKVPFDPNVRRGEDIDYLVNCKVFDIDFLLDRELSIRHLPPKGHVPSWQHFRENIYRFVYVREKLRRQQAHPGLRVVQPEELDPYPGRCMGDDLDDLVFKTSTLMGMHYLATGDENGFRQSMQNVYLARWDAPPRHDPFQWFLDYQVRWERCMALLAGDDTLSQKLLGMM